MINISDIKHDDSYLKQLIVDAGYEVEGHSNDAVIGRIMKIVGSQYLEHVIQQAHLASFNTKQCVHEWVSADNEIVSGCEVCIKCKTIQSAVKE